MSNRVGFTMQLNEREWQRELSRVRRMSKTVNEPWMETTHRRNLQPMATAMRANIKSSRLKKMVGVTTARRKSPPGGARVGVIRNDTSLFPKFSAPALMSVIEYGTDERFRGDRIGGFVIGAISTGKMPARPTLRPAWDQHVRGYIQSTERDIVNQVEKEANR